MDLIQVFIFLFSIISVLFEIKQKVLLYPFAIISSLLSVYVLYIANYQGDVIVNIVYVFMSIYGWVKWHRKGNGEEIKVTKTSLREKLTGLIIFILSVLMVIIVYNILNSQKLELYNYVDTFTSGLFFVATWYLIKKKIENCYIWIFSNGITIPLYFYKGLYLLSLQYFVFFILSFVMLHYWKKKLHSYGI